MSHFRCRAFLRSSRAFIWLRVSFFFFLTGGVEAPLADPGAAPSASLPTGVAAVEPAGVAPREAAGVCPREREGVESPLRGLGVEKASSTIATLPRRVMRPALTSQISGPGYRYGQSDVSPR